MLLKKNRVFARPIKIGETYGNFYIVNYGLKPEEIIAVNNLMKIRDGIPVKIGKVIQE
jgi:membrane fusion protein (multidrug efflux system)